MPLVSLILVTTFPLLATRRFRDGGIRALALVLLLGWGVITVMYLSGWEPAAGKSGFIEVIAYGVVWTVPLLIAALTIILAARFNASSLAQMAVAYVAESLAIAPALWLAVIACMHIRGTACTAP
jgi:hypothetical protein